MYLDRLKHNHFNQNNDRGRHFELSYVFATSKVRVHSHVRFSQSLESTKIFCLQYSLRYLSTFETVVIALGLFKSSSFVSGLNFSLFGLRNHQRWGKAYVHAPYVLCLMPIIFIIIYFIIIMFIMFIITIISELKLNAHFKKYVRISVWRNLLQDVDS